MFGVPPPTTLSPVRSHSRGHRSIRRLAVSRFFRRAFAVTVVAGALSLVGSGVASAATADGAPSTAAKPICIFLPR